jgi:hypothetical protein
MVPSPIGLHSGLRVSANPHCKDFLPNCVHTSIAKTSLIEPELGNNNKNKVY